MQFHFLVFFCLALAACAPQHDASVDVIVPVSLQEQYSEDEPGELVLSVVTEGNFSRTYVLGLLCEPSADDRTATWTLEGPGCAREAAILAWVQSADGASCDMGPEAQVIEPQEVPESAWTAEGVIFPGNLAGCEAGDDTLVLALDRAN